MTTIKPIELISQEAAFTLRMAIVTREGWLKKLYANEPHVLEAELAKMAHLSRELGIEL